MRLCFDAATAQKRAYGTPHLIYKMSAYIFTVNFTATRIFTIKYSNAQLLLKTTTPLVMSNIEEPKHEHYETYISGLSV